MSVAMMKKELATGLKAAEQWHAQRAEVGDALAGWAAELGSLLKPGITATWEPKDAQQHLLVLMLHPSRREVPLVVSFSRHHVWPVCVSPVDEYTRSVEGLQQALTYHLADGPVAEALEPFLAETS